ncbi:enoyl-CoA hydratase [Halieaceae bacterium IMCC14734]|uniref:Enoyl-CoA hydratase n=1 Tax=Candidatus Litorirhabdus singularis TaxID=2518993 RepID=A0ABT3TJJ3_9GAMM|nr:enoyl-CoA hydratase-related protein [Candidatus Litorirhabdus singularis]MCX2981946.1 enoyl-CoA hydratase [Candidatus Litorirhabdus singularis]
MALTSIDTGTDELLATLEDGIALLTLNRPENRNALSEPMLDALAMLLDRCEKDAAIRCVVLTGAGGAFCAGGDVKSMAESDDPGSAEQTLDEVIHRQRLLQRATAGKLYQMPKPTIAALSGAAAGAGMSLALACDLRVMSTRAFLVTAFARVGFSGDYGGSYFLTQLLGTAKARELFYLCERVLAEEALELGLTNWVVEPDTLRDDTMLIARRLADGPTAAFRYMKENLNRAINGDMQECLDMEATHHVHSRFTEDHRESALAFVEKREPVFRGR